MTGSSWIRTQLPKLIDNTDKIVKICSLYQDAGDWTALKLIFLLHYVQIYTNIAPKYFQKVYYIDLFAGCGVNRIKQTPDFIAGSPIVAALFARKQFDTLFLIEKEYEKRICLNKRLSYLKIPNFEILGLNEKRNITCNSEIDRLLPPLKERKSHYLAFIDGYGLEVNWNTLNKLLRCSGDLIIKFPTYQIGRVWENAVKEGTYQKGSIRKMVNFFGENIELDIQRRIRGFNLLEKYMDLIERSGRQITRNISIKSGQGYQYDLILAVRETRGGTPWIKAIDYLKRRIEQSTGKAIKRALDICVGRSKDLEWFFPKETQDKKLDEFL